MLAWQLTLLVWRAERENMHRQSWEKKLCAGQNGIKPICLKYFQGKVKGILCSHCLILKNAKKYESTKEKSPSCSSYGMLESKANTLSVVKKETCIQVSTIFVHLKIEEFPCFLSLSKSWMQWWHLYVRGCF